MKRSGNENTGGECEGSGSNDSERKLLHQSSPYCFVVAQFLPHGDGIKRNHIQYGSVTAAILSIGCIIGTRHLS